MLIASANGYLFNVRTRTFESTGVIALTVEQRPVMVGLNGTRTLANGEITKFTNLFPGYYDLDVAKEGFSTWRKTVELKPGQALTYPSVRLFLAHPKILSASQVERTALLLNQAPADTELDIRGHEIWVKPIISYYPIKNVSNDFALIARYSSGPTDVSWYPGKSHIVMQINDEIRIIDRDGSNDTLLVDLVTSDPTQFIVTEDGGRLIYRDGEQFFTRPLL